MSLAELPADIRAAIEKCKAFQVERDADKPNSPDPAAFVIVTCDETMVMMPPSIPDGDRLARMLTGEKKDLLRYYETHFNCTIYWMKGQVGEGVPAAVEHAKKVRNSHWLKQDLFANAVNSLFEVSEQTKADLAVSPPSAKKY